jgi:superfamily II DNA/RNA helicase
VPTHSEDYVHRIGRTGRAGREGDAVTIVTPEDKRYLAGIETMLGRPIPRRDAEPGEAVIGADEAATDTDSRGRRESRGRRGGGRSRGERHEGRPASRGQEASTSTSDARKGPPQRQSERRPRADEEPDEPVVGLGSHVPDFLLRPVRKASSED